MLPAILAVAAIGAQIAYPLVSGQSLRVVTVAAVLLFFAASVTHAAVRRGMPWAAGLVVIAGGAGLAAEVAGVHTGYPFGQYAYLDTLGPQLWGVPIVVPLAWVMVAYPAHLAGQRAARLTRRHPAALGVLASAWLLASWDLFLDPQMVAAGRWRWAFPTPALPGIPGIPLTNYAGWLAVSLIIMAVMAPLPVTRRGSRSRAGDGVPAALLAWTWLGSALAALAFFGRPGVAAWGLPAMGLVAGPALLRWRRQ